MQTLEESEYKFYVPWEIAVLLALLGFNEACIRKFSYYSHHKLLEQTKYTNVQYSYNNFYYNGKYHERPSQSFIDERWKRYTEEGLKACFKYTYIPAPTYEQVKEWLRVSYDIDFNEYPCGGMDKLYYCEPIVSGRCLNVEPGKTPKEAQLNAFNMILSTLKPLPGQVEELEQVEEQVQEVIFEEDNELPRGQELEEICKHIEDTPPCCNPRHIMYFSHEG